MATVTSTEPSAPRRDSQVLELVTFRVLVHASQQEVLAAAAKMMGWLRQQAGFVSRDLAVTADGEWVDAVRWRSLADALAAAENINSAADAVDFLQLIDGDTVVMRHAAVVLDSAAN